MSDYSRIAGIKAEVAAFFAGRVPGHCTWCGTKLSGRRRTWCSDACSRYGFSHSNPGAFASMVLDRDGHRCRWPECGVLNWDWHECNALSGILLNECPRRRWDWPARGRCNEVGVCAYRKYSRLPDVEQMPPRCKIGIEARTVLVDELQLRRLADQDDWKLAVHHIQPVRHGGSYFDNANAVTLCRIHHGEAHRMFNRSISDITGMSAYRSMFRFAPMTFNPAHKPNVPESNGPE